MPAQRPKSQSINGLWPLLATVATVLILLPGPVRGQDSRVAPGAPPPRVPMYDPGAPVQKKVLKNGVTILVQEQRTSERVAGAVAVRIDRKSTRLNSSHT